MNSKNEELENKLQKLDEISQKLEERVIQIHQLLSSSSIPENEKEELQQELLVIQEKQITVEYSILCLELSEKEKKITEDKQQGRLTLKEALYRRAFINRDRDVARLEQEIAADELHIALLEKHLIQARQNGETRKVEIIEKDIELYREQNEERKTELDEIKLEHEQKIAKLESELNLNNRVSTKPIEDGERRSVNISGINYNCDILQEGEGKNYTYEINGKTVQEVYIGEGHQDWTFVVPSNSSQFGDITVGKQVTELKDGGIITIDSLQYSYMSNEGKINTTQNNRDRIDDKGYIEYENMKVNETTGERVTQTYREFIGGKRTFSRKSNDGIIAVSQDANGTVINICDNEGNVQDTIRYDSKGMPVEARKGFAFNENGELVSNSMKTFKGINQMPENIFESPEVMEVFGGISTSDGGVPKIDSQGYYEQFKQAYPNLEEAQEKLNKPVTKRQHRDDKKDEFEH